MIDGCKPRVRALSGFIGYSSSFRYVGLKADIKILRIQKVGGMILFWKRTL